MVHFIVGTRAQLIKIAPVMLQFKKAGAPYNFIFLAQHKETMIEMAADFGLMKPDVTIGDINSEISHPKLMAKWLLLLVSQLLSRGKTAFRGDRNGIVVVHGDALPALLGAFWAKLNGLRVAHVEAGLRSFDFLNPFPEELIRVALWQLNLADICFCPNEWAMKNLSRYSMRKVNTQHNTLLDSLRTATAAAVPSPGNAARSPLPRPYGLVSLHRAETLMSKSALNAAVSAITTVSARIPLVFVLHPSTRKSLEAKEILPRLVSNPNFIICPRMNYFAFIQLLRNSEFLITDGGSNQEECYYLGHPCLLLRATTERVEGLGLNSCISGFREESILSFVEHYTDYRTPPLEPAISPSAIVFQYLREFVH